MKSKIEEIEKWESDNVIDTISQNLGVPIENIAFIENVSMYIDFISSFEKNDCVSRG